MKSQDLLRSYIDVLSEAERQAYKGSAGAKKIQALNPEIKDVNQIRVGQKIKIPGQSEPYEVKKGDTLDSIAMKIDSKADSSKSSSDSKSSSVVGSERKKGSYKGYPYTIGSDAEWVGAKDQQPKTQDATGRDSSNPDAEVIPKPVLAQAVRDAQAAGRVRSISASDIDSIIQSMDVKDADSVEPSDADEPDDIEKLLKDLGLTEPPVRTLDNDDEADMPTVDLVGSDDTVDIKKEQTDSQQGVLRRYMDLLKEHELEEVKKQKSKRPGPKVDNQKTQAPTFTGMAGKGYTPGTGMSGREFTGVSQAPTSTYSGMSGSDRGGYTAQVEPTTEPSTTEPTTVKDQPVAAAPDAKPTKSMPSFISKNFGPKSAGDMTTPSEQDLEWQGREENRFPHYHQHKAYNTRFRDRDGRLITPKDPEWDSYYRQTFDMPTPNDGGWYRQGPDGEEAMVESQQTSTKSLLRRYMDLLNERVVRDPETGEAQPTMAQKMQPGPEPTQDQMDQAEERQRAEMGLPSLRSQREADYQRRLNAYRRGDNRGAGFGFQPRPGDESPSSPAK